MVLYDKYENMTVDLHNPKYLKDSGTGVFYLKKDMVLQDTYYSGLKDFSTIDIFVLENIHIKNKLYQKITYSKENISFVRMAMKTGLDVGPFTKDFSANGYDFSKWKLENYQENNEEIVKALDKASKISMDKSLVAKNEKAVDDLFVYRSRLAYNQLNLTTNPTGYYSILWSKSEMTSSIESKHAFNDFYKGHLLAKRTSNSGKSLYTIMDQVYAEGVLEIYNTEKYILQIFYGSYPNAVHANRYYDKAQGYWSEWRHMQTSKDLTPTLYNSPFSYGGFNPMYVNKDLRVLDVWNYTEFNVANRREHYYETFFGFMPNSVLAEDAAFWDSNPANLPNVQYTYPYSIKPYDPIPWIYGYTGANTPINLEKGYRDYNVNVVSPPGATLLTSSNLSIAISQGAVANIGSRRFTNSANMFAWMSNANWSYPGTRPGYDPTEAIGVEYNFDLQLNISRYGSGANITLDETKRSRMPFKSFAIGSPQSMSGMFPYINGIRLYWDVATMYAHVYYRSTASDVEVVKL